MKRTKTILTVLALFLLVFALTGCDEVLEAFYPEFTDGGDNGDEQPGPGSPEDPFFLDLGDTFNSYPRSEFVDGGAAVYFVVELDSYDSAFDPTFNVDVLNVDNAASVEVTVHGSSDGYFDEVSDTPLSTGWNDNFSPYSEVQLDLYPDGYGFVIVEIYNSSTFGTGFDVEAYLADI